MQQLEQQQVEFFPLQADSHLGDDETLLAMLGNLAEGADHDGDVLSSGILDFLPTEVQFDDPPVKALIYECAIAWEELQRVRHWKHKLQKRKLGEIRKVKEHKQHQQQEASALQQRLSSASDQVEARLGDQRATERRLRQRLEAERAAVQDIFFAGPFGSLREKEVKVQAKLAQELAEEGRLLAEVQAATNARAELQQELTSCEEGLLEERQQFARLQGVLAEEQRAAGAVHAELRSELAAFELLEPSSPASPVRPSSTFSMGVAFADLASSARVDEEGDDDDAAVEAEVAAAPDVAVARLERRCWRQRKGLQALRDAFGEERASMKRLQADLDRYGPASSEFDEPLGDVALPADGAEATGDPDAVLDAHAREAAGLREALAAREAEAAALVVEVEDSHGAMESELARLAELQERVLDAEDQAEEQELILAEANRQQGLLREELRAEQGRAKEAEREAYLVRKDLQGEVEESRTILKDQRANQARWQAERRKKRGR